MDCLRLSCEVEWWKWEALQQFDPSSRGCGRWFMEGQPAGGHGSLFYRIGAGKTIVAMEAMATVQQHTRTVICNNQNAVDQWVREIIDKPTLTDKQVGTYTGKEGDPAGHSRDLPSPDVALYSEDADYEHFTLFKDHDGGLPSFMMRFTFFRRLSLARQRRFKGVVAWA